MSRAARHPRPSRSFRAVPRPIVGHVLPRELRAPHVATVASTLRHGVRDPAFENLLRRIDGAPLLPAAAVEPYFRGHEAFAAMRAAIAGARDEVLLESYIFKDDEVGQELARDLASAAARGVAVRVLADAFGSFSTRRAFWQTLRDGGVDVRLFHPLLPRLWNQGYRDHRKILVVDRATAFTGGMNVGSEYGAPPRASEIDGVPLDAWRDSHVRVDGPPAWEMAVVFAEGWARAGGTPFAIPPLAPHGHAGAPVLVLDSRPGRGHEESAAALGAIIGAARESVWITNSYFAPKSSLTRLLGDAAARGVDVRLLLPGKSDVPIVRHAGHGFFAGLLRRGVAIFEYDASILHAKSVVADGYVSVVGSTNMDYRSFHWNAECNLVVLSDAVAAKMQAAFAADLLVSSPVTEAAWRRRSMRHKLGDRLARALTPLL
jgi:cardiolipin synthase